jgi:DNA repair protein RecO (recombination protein O)
MNQKRFTTRGIVLSRTNFGEADRIITFITPEHGKVKAIAKGARKAKSKLAGGIEPFSISELTILVGKGDINTLMSSRLFKHFGNLTSKLERLNAASGAIQLINKSTEDDPEPAYYELLSKTLEAFNNLDLPPELTDFWFKLRLLELSGHQPNLSTDVLDQKLDAKQKYNFDIEKMTFFAVGAGKYNANHIKFLRLGIGLNKPQAISRITDCEKLCAQLSPLVDAMIKQNIPVRR